MRKNRFNSDNPMDQFLFCFGSGEDENGGVDFDDTVSTKVGGGATREYESVVEQAAREAGGDLSDYTYFERAQRATGDIPAALSGGDLGVSQALADQAAFQQARDRATAFSNDQIMSLLDEAARENIGQFGLGPRPGASGAVPPPSDARTVLTYDQRVPGMDPLLQEAVKRQQQQAPRTTVTDYEGDIFAMDGMADPFQTMQMAAPVNIPGAPGPVDDYNFPGMPTTAPAPKTAADLGFVQKESTPMTEEERAKAQLEFNRMDLNKDGKIKDEERFLAAQGYGLVGLLSDVGRKMSVGSPTAGLDYEGEAYGTPDAGITSIDRDGAGEDRPAAPAVTAPVAPATCPPGYRFNEKTNACEYVGQIYPGVTPYSGPPITASTQYTGIGGLQPFVLQPTYTAQTPFQPLYRV